MKLLLSNKYIKCLTSKFYTIFIVVILLLLVIATLIHQCNYYVIELPENSILYIYSLIPQVITGLLALTLVALPYQFNLLDTQAIKEEDWIDAVKIAKNHFFHQFIALFLIGISIVMSSTVTLGSFNYSRTQDYFLTLSTTGFLIFIGYFIYLIISSFDPNQLKKIENKVLINLNRDFDATPVSPPTQTIQPKSFDASSVNTESTIDNTDLDQKIGEFLIKYSEMQKNIIEIYQKKVSPSKQTPFTKVLNEILAFGILPLESVNIINEIRVFRNALVHRSPKQEVKPNLLKYYNKRLDTLIIMINKRKN